VDASSCAACGGQTDGHVCSRCGATVRGARGIVAALQQPAPVVRRTAPLKWLVFALTTSGLLFAGYTFLLSVIKKYEAPAPVSKPLMLNGDSLYLNPSSPPLEH